MIPIWPLPLIHDITNHHPFTFSSHCALWALFFRKEITNSIRPRHSTGIEERHVLSPHPPPQEPRVSPFSHVFPFLARCKPTGRRTRNNFPAPDDGAWMIGGIHRAAECGGSRINGGMRGELGWNRRGTDRCVRKRSAIITGARGALAVVEGEKKTKNGLGKTPSVDLVGASCRRTRSPTFSTDMTGFFFSFILPHRLCGNSGSSVDSARSKVESEKRTQPAPLRIQPTTLHMIRRKVGSTTAVIANQARNRAQPWVEWHGMNDLDIGAERCGAVRRRPRETRCRWTGLLVHTQGTYVCAKKMLWRSFSFRVVIVKNQKMCVKGVRFFLLLHTLTGGDWLTHWTDPAGATGVTGGRVPACVWRGSDVDFSLFTLFGWYYIISCRCRWE